MLCGVLKLQPVHKKAQRLHYEITYDLVIARHWPLPGLTAESSISSQVLWLDSMASLHYILVCTYSFRPACIYNVGIRILLSKPHQAHIYMYTCILDWTYMYMYLHLLTD